MRQGDSKSKLYKTLDTKDMINFDFSEKSREIVSSLHFVYYFPRKMFLILYSTT